MCLAQDTTPVNLGALQDLCTALTSATMEDGEESLSVVEFLKVGLSSLQFRSKLLRALQ